MLCVCCVCVCVFVQGVASAALQEAYDDLALRFDNLEVQHAKQQLQLVRTCDVTGPRS